MKLGIFSLLVATLASLLIGCGGGGGTTPPPPGQVAPIFGRVLWIETGAAPSPSATLRVGTVTSQTDTVDGFFDFDVPVGSTAMTVNYTPSGGETLVREFFFPATPNEDTDLGDLYIGPQQISVTGRLTSSATGAPIAGGTVRLAGRQATSGSDGFFTLQNVAFSQAQQVVFRGLSGSASANGFITQTWPIPAETPVVSGSLNVGTISLSPLAGDTPPPLPFNVEGRITPAATGAGASVVVRQGDTVVRTATANGEGRFFVWLTAGVYSVTVTAGSSTATVNLTVTAPEQTQILNVNL